MAKKLAKKVSKVLKREKVAPLTPNVTSAAGGVGANSPIYSTPPVNSNLSILLRTPRTAFMMPDLNGLSNGIQAPNVLIGAPAVGSTSQAPPQGLIVAQNVHHEVQLPLLRGSDAKSTVFRAYELLENILKYTAPQELHLLRGVTTAFDEVIKSSIVIKYITFKLSGIPRSLQEEPQFLNYHVGPQTSEVQLHPFMDRLVRKLWEFVLDSDPDEASTTVDPLVQWCFKIPDDVYVTRPPVKTMSLMLNDPNNIRHIIIKSPVAGVTLRHFIRTLARPLIRRYEELIASNQRTRFPLPDICASIRFKYPVSGVRNINNQRNDDNIDLVQYQQDYGAYFITRNHNTYWFWSANDGEAIPGMGELRRTVWNMPIHERSRDDVTVIWNPVLKVSFWRRDPSNKKSMISAERRGAVHLTSGWDVRWGR
ncbi:hypothetical protein TWF106_006298 [Orbilia oligospora]|uniref:Uncharacterized protein n=1 Tax=Orbilia oligospora TaxID=2813651 RepID=A0A7C8QXG6_ORBOL|nr:hypothetical protein TWF106_006298 [Orbilia oligospora]